jgi:hypothetical protein
MLIHLTSSAVEFAFSAHQVKRRAFLLLSPALRRALDFSDGSRILHEEVKYGD